MAVKFNLQHSNAVAKIIRENFPQGDGNDLIPMIQRGMIVSLALEFAWYFQKGNKYFDPITFLDQCTADYDRYPFSELWDEFTERRESVQ